MALPSMSAAMPAACQKRVRREAKAIQLPRLEAKALESFAALQELSGNLDVALEHYDRALEMLKGESPTTWAYATAGKARCYAAQGPGRGSLPFLVPMSLVGVGA